MKDAYSLILDAIDNGIYRPGDRLVESELAERFGVSRTPVREALRTLRGEGMVELEPNRGHMVQMEAANEVNRAIARFGQRHLAEGGHLYFEINALCGKETVAMLRQENYTEVELIQDLYGKDRIVKAKI